MSKKSKKGKTISLTDFLASEPKVITVRESTWAAIVDEEEEAQKKPIAVDISGLPTAPRSAVDIDYSTLPNNPPFIAHVANLSFEIDDESLRRIFADLNPKTARIIREGNRSRGIGLVEFDTRENLIEGLKRTDKEIYGRKIRINVSDRTDLHQTDGNRGNFGHRSNRTGEERPEMADRWKRIERKSDELLDDRPRSNRNDQGRSNFTGNSRDRQHGSDYGYGYPRSTGDRQGTRPRYNNDDDNNNRQNSRPKYTGRYSDTHETSDPNTPNDDNREPPKERPRLHLQPRTKPLEELQTLSGSSSSVNNVAATSSISNTDDSPNINENSMNNLDEHESHETSDAGSSHESLTVKPLAPSRGAGASIFGGAKPVDTAARELEIEKKLKELQLANSETGEDHSEKGSLSSSSRPAYNRNNERDNYRNKRSSHNDDHHNRDRRDDGRSGGHGTDYHHKREYSGGRRYEDDNRKSNDDDFNRRDRDRYNNPSRRDHDTGLSGKYNHNNRDNYRNRDRETNDYYNQRPPTGEKLHTESQSTNQPRNIIRRTIPAEDDSNKLQLSNKFGMLNDDDDLNGEDVQSPTTDD